MSYGKTFEVRTDNGGRVRFETLAESLTELRQMVARGFTGAAIFEEGAAVGGFHTYGRLCWWGAAADLA